MIPTLFSPEHVSVMRDELQKGVERAGGGKTLGDVEIAPQVQVYVGDDVGVPPSGPRRVGVVGSGETGRVPVS